MGLPGRTRVTMVLVMPPPGARSTLAISMIASVAGSRPVVSMSMTRITGGQPGEVRDSNLAWGQVWLVRWDCEKGEGTFQRKIRIAVQKSAWRMKNGCLGRDSA